MDRSGDAPNGPNRAALLKAAFRKGYVRLRDGSELEAGLLRRRGKMTLRPKHEVWQKLREVLAPYMMSATQFKYLGFQELLNLGMRYGVIATVVMQTQPGNPDLMIGLDPDPFA